MKSSFPVMKQFVRYTSLSLICLGTCGIDYHHFTPDQALWGLSKLHKAILGAKVNCQ